MKKTFLVSAFFVLLFSLNTTKTFAQTDKTLIAFTKSYELEKAGSYAKAIEALKELSPSYELNLRMGWLYYMAGLQTESVNYYQKAIDLMPYAIEAKLGYISPASVLNHWDAVIKQYNAILEIDAQNLTANYGLGYIYYIRKDYAKAYKYFEKCANLYPFTYNYILMYAWTNLQLGKMAEAKILFNKILLIAPNDVSAKDGLTMIK